MSSLQSPGWVGLLHALMKCWIACVLPCPSPSMLHFPAFFFHEWCESVALAAENHHTLTWCSWAEELDLGLNPLRALMVGWRSTTY